MSGASSSFPMCSWYGLCCGAWNEKKCRPKATLRREHSGGPVRASLASCPAQWVRRVRAGLLGHLLRGLTWTPWLGRVCSCWQLVIGCRVCEVKEGRKGGLLSRKWWWVERKKKSTKKAGRSAGRRFFFQVGSKNWPHFGRIKWSNHVQHSLDEPNGYFACLILGAWRKKGRVSKPFSHQVDGQKVRSRKKRAQNKYVEATSCWC